MRAMRPKRACAGFRCWVNLCTMTIALVALTRLDFHKVWINTAQVNTVQGAGQLGYPVGTMLNVGGATVIVNEEVDEVIRILRAAK